MPFGGGGVSKLIEAVVYGLLVLERCDAMPGFYRILCIVFCLTGFCWRK